MPKTHKMMLHTKRDMILINKNMLEVTGDTNPVQAGLYCKKEKKIVRYPHHLYNLHFLYSSLLQRHLCPHHLECYQHIELSAGNAVRNAIWCSSFCCRDSATHAKAWSRSLAASTGRLLWPISAVLTPDLILLAVLCCCCHTYGLIRVVCFFLIMLACQFWEACQAACSTNAFSLGDKMEMTRQSPFCQHCHGSTGTTVYPKVNGMTECQSGRKVCLLYLKWINRRHWRHVTHRCESTRT